MLRLVGVIALVLAGTLPVAAASRLEEACKVAALVDLVPFYAEIRTSDNLGTVTLTANTGSAMIWVTCEFKELVAPIPELSRLTVTPGGEIDPVFLGKYNQAIWNRIILGK